MGAVFSRFRKRKTTIEILKDLDTKIQDIEKYGQNTEQRLKRIVGTLIYSVVLYITLACLFYFYFFPASLYDQIFYITPLLIFPILILFTKKMISWYYKRKISRNHEILKTMQKEKKKILDEVMETETYKKAQEILLKFAPDQLRTMTPLIPQPVSTLKGSQSPLDTTRRGNLSSMSGELRQRGFNVPHRSEAVSGSAQISPASGSVISSPPSSSFQLGNKPTDTLPLGARSPLPRPILSQQRNYLDRLVDYLVGDGPSNRYALICRQCHSHNGMALKEEFEYFEYRCCYCNFWNPARKQKPSAPKLEDWHEDTATPTGSVTSSVGSLKQGLNLDSNDKTVKPLDLETSSPSDTDSDIEVVEKPSEVSEDQESIEQCSNGEDKAVTEEDEASHSKPSQTSDKEEYEEQMEVDEHSSSRK